MLGSIKHSITILFREIELIILMLVISVSKVSPQPYLSFSQDKNLCLTCKLHDTNKIKQERERRRVVSRKNKQMKGNAARTLT